MKTGPVGVILTTMNKAFETAEVIHEDFTSGKLHVRSAGIAYSCHVKKLSAILLAGKLPVPLKDDTVDMLQSELGMYVMWC